MNCADAQVRPGFAQNICKQPQVERLRTVHAALVTLHSLKGPHMDVPWFHHILLSL